MTDTVDVDAQDAVDVALAAKDAEIAELKRSLLAKDAELAALRLAAATQQPPCSPPSQDATPVDTSATTPPGRRPGGIWYKQTYAGRKTQDRQAAARLLSRFSHLWVCPQDERFVYVEPGTNRCTTVMGQVVDIKLGMLSAVAPGMIEPVLLAMKRTIQAEVNQVVPAGSESDGLWHKQVLGRGRHRLVYQNKKGKVVDPQGNVVDVSEGTFQPPLKRQTLSDW